MFAKLKRRGFVHLSLGMAATGASTRLTTANEETPPDFHNLSSPGIDEMDREYDVVIIGSGYGGSVVAYNLAKAFPDAKICILERGKEFHPGDFPKHFQGFLNSIRGPLNKLGLIDANLGMTDARDLDIISGNGLGGTSLINAAIALRPHREVFLQPEWPSAIRRLVASHSGASLGALAPYFTRAEQILGSNIDEKFALTKNSSIFGWVTRKIGFPKFKLLRLSIKFGKRPSCEHAECDQGLERPACTYCGDCCSGCNYGAKNILPYNYLRLAGKYGCRIFSRTEVAKLGKESDGSFSIQVKETVSGRRKTIRAEKVILAAGTRGSTRLLLKAREQGLSFSSLLGSRLSLNGDVMGVCYNGLAQTNLAGIGQENSSAPSLPPACEPGPGITTAVNPVMTGDLSHQFTMMNCTIPSPLVNVIAKGLASHAHNHPEEMNFSKEQWERVKRDNEHLPIGKKAHPEGALNYSTVFLACGHDSGSGKYCLDATGNIRAIYEDIVEQPFFRRVTDHMRKATETLGGVYFDNPRTTLFKGKMTATHPLGGCPMGDDCQSGVVNDKGQVFDGEGGIHKGLYVVDGSIIPRSLGAPPSLTIAALAERISEWMIKCGISQKARKETQAP